jgi:CMP-N,N'-diacetyllegionaminic acid synthase
MLKKQLLIIIPARSGSKTIKNKNLIKINRKPLIQYSFEISSKIKEKSKEIYCSTDSIKIKNLAKKFHITSQPLRPKKYSQDLSRDIDFVNHALKVFGREKKYFKYCLILRPTNPLRSVNNLNKSYKSFIKNYKADSLKSIYPSKKTPFKSWIKFGKFIKPTLKIKGIKECFNAPKQILPATFDQTGTYEYIRINFKSSIKSISGKKIMYFDIPKKESIDIDNLDDIKKFKSK